MKTDFLNGLGLSDEQIKAIQAESGKDITAEKQKFEQQINDLNGQITTLQGTVSQRDADLKGLQTKLTEAGQSATKLADLQNEFTTLQTKYDTDTKAYQTQLEDQAYKSALVQQMTDSKLEFSCKAAKTAFMDSLMNSRLPMQDGALIGFNDYVTKQKESDPGAFKVEENPNKPTIVPPAPQQEPPAPAEKDPFGWGFAGV